MMHFYINGARNNDVYVGYLLVIYLVLLMNSVKLKYIRSMNLIYKILVFERVVLNVIISVLTS